MKKKKSLKQDIKKKLKEVQEQKDEYLNSWKRERADFLNYKKQETERITELLNYAGTGLVLKLLPILDNFDLAEKNMPEDLKKGYAYKRFISNKRADK
jgi:molecular chaperone GrpE